MDTATLSDRFFTIFILCGAFSALLMTNGAMLSRGGFSITAFFSNSNKAHHEKERKKSEKDSLLEFSMMMTVAFFILFIMLEFVLVSS